MATPGRHCALAYPERFYAAFAFAQDVPDGAAATSDAARLLLYALYQQVRARVGGCAAGLKDCRVRPLRGRATCPSPGPGILWSGTSGTRGRSWAR